jgi:GT2 family glycosyltransferase
MNESGPLVYIVIVNYNGWKDTLECLSSLGYLTYPRVGIVVIDNASSDNSETLIREHDSSVTLLQSGSNLGYASGNNLGIRYALKNGADYVWLLNNDTVVDTQALDHLVQRMQQDPKVGMCGSTLLYYHKRDTIQVLAGATYNQWLGISSHLGKDELLSCLHDPQAIEQQLDYIIGASMLVSRTFLEEVGLMNEAYFLYYEEIDWATRAKGKFTLGYAPASIIYHKEGASVGTTKLAMSKLKRLRSEYYGLRSRLLFTRSYFPVALPSVYLGILLMFVTRAAKGEWARVKTLAEALWLLLTNKRPA